MERKALVNTVGTESDNLKDKCLFHVSETFSVTLMQLKAAPLSNDWFRSVLVGFLYITQVFWPVAWHFSLPHHTKQHLLVCPSVALSGVTWKVAKTLKKINLQIGSLSPTFLFHYVILVFYVTMPPPIAQLVKSVFNHTLPVIRSFALT